jgi:hypothetical protein
MSCEAKLEVPPRSLAEQRRIKILLWRAVAPVMNGELCAMSHPGELMTNAAKALRMTAPRYRASLLLCDPSGALVPWPRVRSFIAYSLAMFE